MATQLTIEAIKSIRESINRMLTSNKHTVLVTSQMFYSNKIRAHHSSIVKICVAIVDNSHGYPIAEQSWFIKPEGEFPTLTTSLLGISEEDCCDCSDFSTVMIEVKQFICQHTNVDSVVWTAWGRQEQQRIKRVVKLHEGSIDPLLDIRFFDLESSVAASSSNERCTIDSFLADRFPYSHNFKQHQLGIELQDLIAAYQVFRTEHI